jgi:hypothetical protein
MLSAPGKPRIKSSFWPSGLTVLTTRISYSRPDGQKARQKQLRPRVKQGTSSWLITIFADFLEMTSMIAQMFWTLLGIALQVLGGPSMSLLSLLQPIGIMLGKPTSLQASTSYTCKLVEQAWGDSESQNCHLRILCLQGVCF